MIKCKSNFREFGGLAEHTRFTFCSGCCRVKIRKKNCVFSILAGAKMTTNKIDECYVVRIVYCDVIILPNVDQQNATVINILYCNSTCYNSPPEDESSGSKQVRVGYIVKNLNYI